MKRFIYLVSAAGLAFASPALATDDVRKFSWSVTGAGTSDYIFRGFSQTNEDPAAQASIDATYGIVYAGIWGSHIDLGSDYGSAEIDLYAGLKPVLGPVTFDLGVIYYYYPGSEDPLGLESDYVELKIGASMTPFENASVSGTYFYTPDNFAESGDAHTFEATLAYTFPAVGIFTPTINVLVGHVIGDDSDPHFAGFEGDDNYTYWNAGLALTVEKLTFDFRYWDTDLDNTDLADERFVFTAKVTLP